MLSRYKVLLLTILIISGLLFQRTNLSLASIPMTYETSDLQDDIVLYYYNITSNQFVTVNSTAVYNIDIFSLAYNYDKEVENFTISLELNGEPLINGNNYYRIQLISENSTSRFSIDIQFGTPSSSNNTDSVYRIGIQGNTFDLEEYNISPIISGNTINWEIQTSSIFDADILVEDPSIAITSFSAVVEHYLNNSYYFNDEIEVKDIQSIFDNSTNTQSEGLFDIIDPVAILVFLVVPLIILIYFVIRRRSLY